MTTVECVVEIDVDDATSQVVKSVQMELSDRLDEMATEAAETAVSDCDIESAVQAAVVQEVDDVDVSDTVENAVTEALTGVDWEGEIPSHLWDSMYAKLVEKLLNRVIGLEDRVHTLEQSKLRGR